MSRLQFLTHLLSHPTPAGIVELLGIGVVGLACLYLLTKLSPTWQISLALCAEAFSGFWKLMGVELPLDRLLVVTGLGTLLLGGIGLYSGRRVKVRWFHLLLLVVATYGVCSAIGAGTITTSLGFYALLDRLGLIPFLLFALSPHLFGTKHQRNVLLVVIIVFGAYLGLTALAEEARFNALVLPHYILNDSIGITTGRVRGPYANAEADGMIMTLGAIGAGIGLTEWRARWSRVGCWLVIIVCAIGVFLTLTRAVWIGAAAGLVVASVVDTRVRRRVLALLVIGSLGVVAALLIPEVRTRVLDRVNTTSSIWDRLNMYSAGFRVLAEHPVFGIGWVNFPQYSLLAMRQAAGYPITAVGLEIHDVFLARLVDFGLVGGSLTILALVWIILCGCRRVSPELESWRVGFLTYSAMFVSVAAFAPLAAPEPTLAFWLLAGIATRDQFSVPRHALLPAEGSWEREAGPDVGVAIGAYS